MSIVGVGIDLVDVARAEALLERHGERLLDRVLTSAEKAYVLDGAHPARHLAVRLAAKEAVYKALQPLPGARRVGWRDMEVCPDGHGRPHLRLHGVAADLEAEAGGLRVHLSLSHSDQTAGATAVIER